MQSIFAGILLLCAVGHTNSFAFASHSRTFRDSSTHILAAKDSTGPSSKPTVKPWEFGRFLKTLNFYDVLKPKFSFFPFRDKRNDSLKLNKDFQLWSPTNRDLMQWGPLDDVVMGGRSKSDLQFGDTFDGTWTGVTTAEGGGGFTGIRTKLLDPPLDLSESVGFELVVKGDGQRYKFIARWDEDWNGLAWSYSFDTIKDKTIKVRIPFSQLRATKYAKTVPGVYFDRSTLRALQLSLSKFEYDGGLNPKWREGPFKLKVESIKTF